MIELSRNAIPKLVIGQIIGADEGQCQDARNSKDFVKSLQLPLLGVGVLFGLSGGMLIVRDD